MRVKRPAPGVVDQHARNTKLNPDIKLRVLELLHVVRLEYDEERGEIGKQRFK